MVASRRLVSHMCRMDSSWVGSVVYVFLQVYLHRRRGVISVLLCYRGVEGLWGEVWEAMFKHD